MRLLKIGAMQQQVTQHWGYNTAQIQAFIDAGYIPVGNAADLDAVRADQTDRDWATGTKWAVTLSSTGLAGSYIQVADIDLDIAPYNTGTGWSSITIFTGNYDGAGHIIHGVYVNQSTGSRHGLFGEVYGNINNIFLLNVYIKGTILVGAIGFATLGARVDKILVTGRIEGDSYVGGVAGANYHGSKITNSYSSSINTQLTSTDLGIGGITGFNRYADSEVKNSISGGFIIGLDAAKGGLIGLGLAGTFVSNSYYNTETSGQSDIGKGVPKTTAEMLAGVPSAGIYTDWDNEIDSVTGRPVWQFKAGYYPILTMFGMMGANCPPPTSLDSSVSGGDINLTWTAPTKAPIGYNVYVSIANGAWTKINPALLTVTNFSYTHGGAAAYNFFVKAVYHIRNFDQETGNSITHLRTIV